LHNIKVDQDSTNMLTHLPQVG